MWQDMDAWGYSFRLGSTRAWFEGVHPDDRAAVRARKSMKRLYAGLHIRPDARADAVLFKDEPPEESLAYKLKRLAKAATAAEQAALIVEHRLPYAVAVGAVGKLTPSVLVALISQMSPQEVINNLGSLKKRGALEHAEVKALVDEKLKAAATSERVSAFKALKAAEVAGVSEETVATLGAVAGRQVKRRGGWSVVVGDVLDARAIVDGWTSADDVGCSKPCPDIFAAALLGDVARIGEDQQAGVAQAHLRRPGRISRVGECGYAAHR